MRNYDSQVRSISVCNSEPSSRPTRNWIEQLSSRFKLNKADLGFLLVLGTASIYMLIREPVLVCILLCSSLFSIA